MDCKHTQQLSNKNTIAFKREGEDEKKVNGSYLDTGTWAEVFIITSMWINFILPIPFSNLVNAYIDAK